MPHGLLTIAEYDGQGYKPLVDFASWRVAILNYDSSLLPERLTRMQRHNETDEVFVLLAGRCLLFVADGGEEVGRIQAEDLQPHRLYTVRQGVWHTHTLSPGTKVLVVENRDTTYDNSPFAPLNEAQQRQLLGLVETLWPGQTG